MGLDITVYKVVPLGNRIPESIEDYYTLDDFPELKELFGQHSFIRKNGYHDVESAINAMGLDITKLETQSIEYSEQTTFKVINTASPFYECFVFLNAVWHKVYCPTQDQLEATEEFKIFKEKYLDLLLSNGWEEGYVFLATGSGESHNNLNNAREFVESKTIVKLVDPTVIYRDEECITFDEVGYQRKGANKQFYDDGMWDAPCVVDLKTLEEHWEKYFSETNELKHGFKRNVIDNFVAGETFVIYH